MSYLATSRANSSDAAIESLHFKNRILDFFDIYARRQAANPLVLEIILPLLRLVRSGSGELANKAAGVLRTRVAKATHAPSNVSDEKAKEILAEIHRQAQRAANAEFSALCSSASLFVARAAPGPALDAYRATLTDFMTRKGSEVRPSFVAEYIRRHPAKAWSLAPDLVKLVAPGGSGVNAYRQTQGYTFLGALFQQVPQLVKAGDVAQADAEKVIRQAASDVYATLEAAATSTDAKEWKADRLKEVVKFALQLARAAKTLAGDKAAELLDVKRLATVTEQIKAGQRTKEMKSIHQLLQQLAAVLGAAKPKEKKAGKAAPAKAANGDDDDEAEPEAEAPKPTKRKAPSGDKAKSKGKKVKSAP